MAGLITDWMTLAAKQLDDDVSPAWLKAKKEQALEQLSVLKTPDRKLEYWRYTDTKRLDLSGYEPSLPSELALHDRAEDCEVVTIRLHDAGFEVSENCPISLLVKSIKDINESEWIDLDFTQETVINLVNTANFCAGVTIKYNHTETSKPIKLIVDYDFSKENEWRYVRNQFQVSQNSKISIQEQWSSGQTNVVNVFDLEAGAEIQRLQQANLRTHQRLISFNQFQLAGNTAVRGVNQHLGGALQHHIHRINFNGSQASFKMGTVNKSINNNNIADLVEVNHHKKNNQSEVTHRSIADDSSQIFTNAKAYVAVGADDSQIEQDLKNILLSPGAKIFSKPELEVYADEVVAAHGSTIGALDEQSLFYLQSRGIGIKQAREIMIESFEQEALTC